MKVVGDCVGRAEVVAGVGELFGVVVGEGRHEPDGVGTNLFCDVAEGDAEGWVCGRLEEVVDGTEADPCKVGEPGADGVGGEVTDLGRGLGGTGLPLFGRTEERVAGVGRADLQFVEQKAVCRGRRRVGWLCERRRRREAVSAAGRLVGGWRFARAVFAAPEREERRQRGGDKHERPAVACSNAASDACSSRHRTGVS